MISLERALSSVTIKPDVERGLRSTPFINKDGYVDYYPHDPENPRNWSPARRWFITIIGSFLSLNGNLASSSTSGSVESIAAEYGISQVEASLVTTLYLLGFCAGPFLFAPISEFYGRRWILYVTFAIYLAFTFLCAFPPNFGGLLIGRFLAGTFVAAPLSTVPGVLVDLWDPIERGNAMAIYSLAAWVGPSLGPIISGFMQLEKNWRWSMYINLWLGAAAQLLLFTVPETHSPTILAKKAEHARRSDNPDFKTVQAEGEESKPSLGKTYKLALTRPWALMFDFISFLCSMYITVVFILQFMLFSIYPIVFKQMRGWNSGVSQLPLLGQIVGAFIGAAIIFMDSERRRKIAASGRELPPEDRLLMAMIGGVGFPITMFWFAWSAQFNQVHWLVPTIGGTFLSTSLMLIFVAFINYLTDAYAEFAASVIAANTVARSAGSAAAPLFTTQMFDTLNIGGGGSLIAGVAALLAFIPFIFYRFGDRMRRSSKYALADRDADEPVDEEVDPTDYGAFPGETQHAGELGRNAQANSNK